MLETAPDTTTVTMAIASITPAGPRLSFASIDLEIHGIAVALHGVRIIAGRDGQRTIAPPLHVTGRQGKVTDGWSLPEEITAAIVKLLEEEPSLIG